MQDYILIDGTLYHHGILGQKWGRRRFQNEDGSLTEEGRRRYLKNNGSLTKSGIKAAERRAKQISRLHGKEKSQAQSKFSKDYGISYTNTRLYGAKEANKIGKYARKKGLNETKATYKYFGKQIATNLLAAGGWIAASAYYKNHSAEVNKGIAIASSYLKMGIDELKVKLDPNIVDATFNVVGSSQLLDYK